MYHCRLAQALRFGPAVSSRRCRKTRYMQGTRLSGDDAAALAQKITSKTLECDSAASALERASSVVRARGLSVQVLERILASNSTAASRTLTVIEHGVVGSTGDKFDSIRVAVKVAGIDTVWYAALVANFTDFALALLKKARVENRGFVAPSLACAETAHWLSARHIVDPTDAFTRALFADVGLFAMIYALPEVYLAMAKSETQEPLCVIEQSLLGFDHQQIGALLLTKLKFPDAVVSFAAKHHTDPLMLTLEEKMVKAAYVAVESESSVTGLNTGVEGLSMPVLYGAMLKDADVPELMSVTRRFLARATKIVSLDVPDAA